MVKLTKKLEETAACDLKQGKPVESSDKEQKLKTEAFELLCQNVSSDLSETLRKELGLSSPLNSSSENKRPKQEIIVI